MPPLRFGTVMTTTDAVAGELLAVEMRLLGPQVPYDFTPNPLPLR